MTTMTMMRAVVVVVVLLLLLLMMMMMVVVVVMVAVVRQSGDLKVREDVVRGLYLEGVEELYVGSREVSST